MVRIEISDDELAAMNIGMVFDWMAQMKQFDTANIEPMFTPAAGNAPLREDIVTVPNIRESVLANAPDKTGVARGYFAVPKVMDE